MIVFYASKEKIHAASVEKHVEMDKAERRIRTGVPGLQEHWLLP
jgi:hypothetical protein